MVRSKTKSSQSQNWNLKLQLLWGRSKWLTVVLRGTNLAVLILKVGALGFATSAVLFHLHPMKKHFSIYLTKTRVCLQKIKIMSMRIGRRDLRKFTPLRQVDGAIVPSRQTRALRHLEQSFSSPPDFAVVIFYLDPCIKQALTAPIDMFSAQMRPSEKSTHNSCCHLPHAYNMSKMRHLHFRSVALYNGSLA